MTTRNYNIYSLYNMLGLK